MKLELKHLAPYLPYRLTIYDKYKNSDKFDIYEMTLNNFNGVMKNDLRKPILLPSPFKDFINRDYTYNEWMFFFKMKYDVFGLIEKGLAININTI